MLQDNELDRLLLAAREGSLDEEGRLRLEAWAEESDANRELLGLVTGTSPLAGELKALYSYDEEQAWTNIRRRAARNRRMRLYRVVARTAAAAMVTVGLLWGADALHDRYERRDELSTIIAPGRTMAVLELSSGMKVSLTDAAEHRITEADRSEIVVGSSSTTFRQSEEPAPDEAPLFNTVTVPKGGEYRIELSDGTAVWLNAESEITFPTRFDGGTRTVTLRGEAYFEVKSDPDHPFVVRTDDLMVRVLGTSFNLMTYADDPTVETTLVSGSLQVIREGTETLLEPGMQARFDRANNTMITRTVYADGYAAWAKRMFVFFNEPIESICRKLARWYDIEIDASDADLREMRYSGMIERAETFNSIADLLSATDELIFRERGGRVIVERKRP